jgi:hypothetical protein
VTRSAALLRGLQLRVVDVRLTRPAALCPEPLPPAASRVWLAAPLSLSLPLPALFGPLSGSHCLSVELGLRVLEALYRLGRADWEVFREGEEYRRMGREAVIRGGAPLLPFRGPSWPCRGPVCPPLPPPPLSHSL